MSDRRHYVYRAYDAADRILYIGCTGNLDQRYAGHRSSSAWWPYAARFELSGPYERDAALDLERDEIRTRRPYFNALPESTRLVRRLASREREIRDRLMNEAGWSQERFERALNAGKHHVMNELRPVFVAAHAMALADVGLRTTEPGRLHHYLNVLDEAGEKTPEGRAA